MLLPFEYIVLSQVPDNYHRDTTWGVYSHALPAKQRVLKLNHYWHSLSLGVSDAITKAKGKYINDRTNNNSHKTPNLGTFYFD